MNIQETKLVLWVSDLAGFARATGSLDAMSLASFCDEWYRACGSKVRSAGGRVVKFMGDACFATFPEEKVVAAVDAAVGMHEMLVPICTKHRMMIDVGSNIHLGIVAEGEFGDDADKRYDVLGNSVVHLFRMGGGVGVRISEPVYRSLPNEARSPWEKHKPPATYSLSRR